MVPLNGKTILVVEDEVIVAMMVEDMLLELGASVVGPVATVELALRLVAEHRIDAALLDVNLNGQRSYPIADELRQRGIPFVFATGYGSPGYDTLDALNVVQKPYQIEQMEAALATAMAGPVTGPKPSDHAADSTQAHPDS